MSSTELVALVCCDLGGIVRGRSLLTSELGETLQAGVGWVPANHSLTPHGLLAEHTPFDSTGDLRLLPDPDTHVRVEAESTGSGMSDTGANALELVLCDIVETDGARGSAARGGSCATPSRSSSAELGARVVASFEHEFQLLGAEEGAAAFASKEPGASTGAGAGRVVSPKPAPGASFSPEPAAAPFSLEAQRRAEPFAAEAIGRAGSRRGRSRSGSSRSSPPPVRDPRRSRGGGGGRRPRRGAQGGRARGRPPARAARATFTPLLAPRRAGQRRARPPQPARRRGRPAARRRRAPGCLSERAGASRRGSCATRGRCARCAHRARSPPRA